MKEDLNGPRNEPSDLEPDGNNGDLDLYLSLPKKQRDEQFAGTLRAAEMAGLSQRTIQLWIECGKIRAVCVGRKYQVNLDSLLEHLRSLTNNTRC